MKNLFLILLIGLIIWAPNSGVYIRFNCKDAAVRVVHGSISFYDESGDYKVINNNWIWEKGKTK